MGARAPYGYLKPDEDVTSLVINPETAPVVKMIFQKYLDGMNITQLARYLNEQKIMSPGQYKREVLKTGVKKTTEKYIWYPVTVRLILMTETYTGTTIGGKWKVASVGSNKHLKTKEEDWIVVEGTHEAIVSKEVFDAVQEKLELNSRKRSKTHNNNYPLKGLVKCGGCGQNLQHVTRCNPHFKCPRKFNAANQDCVTDNLYDDEFNEMIFRAIKLFAKISDDAEPVLELQKAELKSKVRLSSEATTISLHFYFFISTIKNRTIEMLFLDVPYLYYLYSFLEPVFPVRRFLDTSSPSDTQAQTRWSDTPNSFPISLLERPSAI